MIPDGGPQQGGTDAAGEQLPEILENSIVGHGHRGTNAGIGIAAPIVSVRYRPKKNTGLRRLSPVEELFRQRCCIVRHFGIYIYR
jgi:hypothetical protein